MRRTTKLARPRIGGRIGVAALVALVVTSLAACSGGGQPAPTTAAPRRSTPSTPTTLTAGQTSQAVELALVWKLAVPRTRPHVGSVAGIAADAAGDVYLADGVTSKVRVYSPDGKLLRAWGTAGTGRGQLDFRVPSTGNPIVGGSIAVAPNGTVYVTSPGDGRVEGFDPRGRLLSEWGGLGQGKARFSLLADVAVGPNGDVTTIDDGPSTYAIQRFGPTGAFLSGYGNYEKSGLFTPALGDVAPSGDVYLADPGLTGNGGVVHPKIIRFSPDGVVMATWGAFGVGPGEFQTPYSVEVDAAGHVFVGDIQSGQIQEFDAAGRPLAAYGLSAGGSATPWSMALDGRGDLFVLDDNTFTLYRFRLPG